MGWGVHDYPGPPPEKPMPRCPVCGEECETIYRDIYGEIFACDLCLRSASAYETEECFPENRRENQ